MTNFHRRQGDKKMAPNEMDNLYVRLGNLEQDNAAMSTSLKNVAHTLDNLALDISTMKSDHQTNWGVLASWASVIIAVMIFHTSLALNPIKDAADFDRQEILRVRAWKDQVEATIPVLENDIKWLEKTITSKTAERYGRSEAVKDIENLKSLISKHEHKAL